MVEWEQNLEDGLGLKRIKMGADEKDRGYVLKRARALQIGVCATILIVISGYMLITSSSAMHTEQIKVLAAQEDVRAQEHAGLISMANMGAELEAHLLHEGHESFAEREFLSKEENFEADLLERMQSGLNETFASFLDDTVGDEYFKSLDQDQREDLLALLRTQNEELRSIVLQEIEAFRNKMSGLARGHLKEVAAQSRNARARLQELHSMLKQGIAAELRQRQRQKQKVARVGPTEEAALLARLDHFFDKAKRFKARHAVKLPRQVHEQLKDLLATATDGHDTAAIEQKVKTLLIGNDGHWRHGAPPYAQQGIASYLQEVLFASDLHDSGAAQLDQLQHSLEKGDIAAVVVLEILMTKVQNGYPSDWLVE